MSIGEPWLHAWSRLWLGNMVSRDALADRVAWVRATQSRVAMRLSKLRAYARGRKHATHLLATVGA